MSLRRLVDTQQEENLGDLYENITNSTIARIDDLLPASEGGFQAIHSTLESEFGDYITRPQQS